ncbi:MAG: Nif3-like dinuclear metal center hexameric protein [Phycisphaerales bacterium]|jgi:dinuclear metal center YbgI/SA1388 family protein|nr:Nif3-like dinuclear metal center hexameric protein [Phycisphaerales bacterium]MBT7170677.1 Nif3-like dinuclear metal center hexameric protein [Phycisphaerales bacterium]
MNVDTISNVLEEFAPAALACEWDNVGLLVGDPAAEVSRVLFCIDLTEAVLDEAIERGCEMVMAYHPVIFRGIKSVTPASAPVVFRAMQHGIAIHSMHTALDVAAGGTNDVLAEVVGLSQSQPLEPVPAPPECKLVVFVPRDAVESVSAAAFSAGAGRIGTYRECSFTSEGVGTFYGEEGSAPAIGEAQTAQRVPEIRIEMICPVSAVDSVQAAMTAAHPYETPAVDVYPLQPQMAPLGMGRIGTLDSPTSLSTMVDRIKAALGVEHVLLGEPAGGARELSRVAVAAGSAGDSFRAAMAAGAELYLTGEMRHHDVLAATGAGMAVVCVCHSNSERVTLAKLTQVLAPQLAPVELLVSSACRDPFTIV